MTFKPKYTPQPLNFQRRTDCPWINNCVGIHNHNAFLVFLCSLTVVFLVICLNCIWATSAPCKIKSHIDRCPLSELCFAGLCEQQWLRDFVAIVTICITIFFGLPVSYLSYIACKNYSMNKTTNERFAKQPRTQSSVSEISETSSFHSRFSEVGYSNALLPGGPGGGRGRRRKTCLNNFKAMCCNQRVITQQQLLDKHMAESTTTGTASLFEESRPAKESFSQIRYQPVPTPNSGFNQKRSRYQELYGSIKQDDEQGKLSTSAPKARGINFTETELTQSELQSDRNSFQPRQSDVKFGSMAAQAYSPKNTVPGSNEQSPQNEGAGHDIIEEQKQPAPPVPKAQTIAIVQRSDGNNMQSSAETAKFHQFQDNN